MPLDVLLRHYGRSAKVRKLISTSPHQDESKEAGVERLGNAQKRTLILPGTRARRTSNIDGTPVYRHDPYSFAICTLPRINLRTAYRVKRNSSNHTIILCEGNHAPRCQSFEILRSSYFVFSVAECLSKVVYRAQTRLQSSSVINLNGLTCVELHGLRNNSLRIVVQEELYGDDNAEEKKREVEASLMEIYSTIV